MALFLKNFDLGFFQENDDTFIGLMEGVRQEGKEIVGYYGLPYHNRQFGHVQMVLKTAHMDMEEELLREIEREEGQEVKGAIRCAGLDTHAIGNAIWEVMLHGIDIDRKDSELLEKRVAVTRLDGSGGIAIVNLVNADVLPSFLENDKIKMQMVAFPLTVEYFENEESYANSQPEMENGDRFCLGEGAVFPSGLMRNRDPNSDECDSNDDLDDLTVIRGKVENLWWGTFELNDEKFNSFIRCRIETEFGPLDIVHTIDQVAEEYRDNIRKGATVSVYAVLSGDVAICEYDNGIVRNEENNLAALRYVFSRNDPERLRSILRDDAVYRAEYNKQEFVGKDAIIERMKLVQSFKNKNFEVCFCTIKSVDEGEEDLDYGVGKRCLGIMECGESDFYSVAFIDMDEQGYISRIVTSTNDRYHFAVDHR